MAKSIDEVLQMIEYQIEIFEGTDFDVLSYRILVECYEKLVDLEMELENGE